jgi:hypothetical protein
VGLVARALEEPPLSHRPSPRHAFLLSLVLGCAPPPEPPAKPQPEVVLHGVTLRSYRGASVTAVGRAERLSYERGSSNVEVDKGILELPARSATGSPFTQVGGVEIRAPRADGNLEAQRVEAYGGVDLKTGSGVRASTDRALFDGDAGVTSGMGPVQVRGPTYALDAVGFVLRSDEEDFSFGGPLRSGLGKPVP